jgi:hypothetical protein
MNMGSDKENPADEQKKNAADGIYEVTAEGSLGMLALGAQGIRAWRKKREEEKQNSKPAPGHE